jgi:hypothetical protein
VQTRAITTATPAILQFLVDDYCRYLQLLGAEIGYIFPYYGDLVLLKYPLVLLVCFADESLGFAEATHTHTHAHTDSNNIITVGELFHLKPGSHGG